MSCMGSVDFVNSVLGLGLSRERASRLAAVFALHQPFCCSNYTVKQVMLLQRLESGV